MFINIQVTPVVCSRKGSYDAEVQLKEGLDEPVYKQVLIQSGFLMRADANKAAQDVADHLKKLMWSAGRDYLTSKYKDAQP